MAIGLLNCDHVNEAYQAEFKDYPTMFRSFLPNQEFKVYNVCDGEFPKDVSECDAYLVGGSKASVYNFVDWIVRLKEFILEIYWSGKPYVGVCFGHQILAEALGGIVTKAPTGWNVGLQEMNIIQKEPWMKPYQDSFNVLMMCQDQVTTLPENSFHLASAKNCPNAMFRVGIRMVGIQGHPEFTKEYVKLLLNDRVDRIGKDKTEAALAGLDSNGDQELLSKWFEDFLVGEQVNDDYINL